MTALSKDGELNTSFIQKELVHALEEDRTYHLTDEAKKKHITTAATYDEFRHLVACADLKRVTRKEMNSLGKPEKGWQTKGNLATGVGKAKGGRASVRKDKAKAAGAAQIEIFFPVSAPKSPMSFDRDWRRHCTSRELKLQYLRLCGAENIRKIFKTEIDVALLGKIIQAFAETATLYNSAVRNDGTAAASTAAESAIALEIFSYMRVFPETGRFTLNIEFLEEHDRVNVRKCLTWLQANVERGTAMLGGSDKVPTIEVESFTSNELAALRSKFKV